MTDLLTLSAYAARQRALPDVAREILDVVEDERFSGYHLSQVITSSEPLAAQVLRLANSPFSGFPRRIVTARDAVAYLGFRAVRSMALAACLADALPSPAPDVLDRRGVWRFSVIVGLLAEVLARADGQHTDAAFTGGMLHSVGRLALAEHRPEDFHRSVELAQRERLPLVDVQRRTFGYTDAQLGRELAREWGFPDPLVAAAGAADGAGAGCSGSVAALVRDARAYVLARGETDGADPQAHSTAPLWSAPRVAASLQQAGGWRGILGRSQLFLEHAGVG